MQTQDPKRTPLYEEHVKLGGKIVPFAGWELPVQYTGVIEEHRAVRTAAGIFDVSHMGEIFVTGKDAEAALNYMTCNNVGNLYDGKAQYTAIINDKGGVVDDIIIYRYNRNRYLLCVNASNAEKDFAWLTSHNKHEAEFVNASAEYGQIALQGPQAAVIMKKLSAQGAALKFFHFCDTQIGTVPVIVARTGYTGEDGFELFVPWQKTAEIWRLLLETGKSHGLMPAGLGARDSLRLEACFPLHGHELSDGITAIESGLGWVVKFEKGEFIGGSILEREKREGSKRSLVGFFLDDAGIARHGDKILSQSGEEIGFVMSGTRTPTLNRSLGLGLVSSSYSAIDTALQFDVRGRSLKGHVVKRPFYSLPRG